MAQKVLLVKLSSLGDVVHSFAALRDMHAHGAQVTWAVEEAFAPLVGAHPLVGEVIPVAIRRLRRAPGLWWRKTEWREMRAALHGGFDVAVDAQGLLKSAILLRMADGIKAGFDRMSVRERAATWFYQQKISVEKKCYAPQRTRLLCAAALGYTLSSAPDYGLPLWQPQKSRELFFFHGTTWASKRLPTATWQQLLCLAAETGYRVRLFWGNAEEKRTAQLLAQSGAATVAERMTLNEILTACYDCAGVISVDTGLGHLAGACGVPTVGIFGATDSTLTGIPGKRAVSLAHESPCMCRDCRKHGAAQSNHCMAKWQAEEIWRHFVQLKEQEDA